uniref:DNA-(apurinic or apyrimidinic site) endonuclease n=1 Tax=Anthurium amnicola TaxID=1678845 RepID=A0A1D1XPU0_9ARAE
MGTKRRTLKSPSGGDKKMKKSVQPEDGAEAEANIDQGIETLRNDLSRLETMTVKELKAVMKDAGIHAKGRKQDLISALGSFLLKPEDEVTPLISKDTLPVVKTKDAGSAPSKSKKKDLSIEDSTQVLTFESDVSGSRKLKHRGTSQMHESDHNGNSGIVMEGYKHHSSGSQTSLKVSSKTSTLEKSLPAISDEPWTVLAHKKPQPGWVSYNPVMMRPPPLPDGTKMVKLISWNVNGLRALLKLGGSSALELAQRENFDVLCLQETKLQEKDVEEIKERLIDGYDYSFWTCSLSKLGYSGTAVISRIKPISVRYGLGIQDHDSEGRLVTVEFDTFYLLSGYVPNSGEGLKRLTYRVTEWDPSLSNYMKDLERSKPVILTGDLNCAHEEIDIYNPAGNRRSAGFTDEERQSFEKNFLSRGFVDTFRRHHSGVVGYTYWGYRHVGRKTNKGWRLDYFLVSESIADDVHDSYILPDVFGSDHCPIGLVLKV